MISPLEFRSEDVDEGVNHVDYLVRNFIYRLHNVSKQLSITMLWKRVIERVAKRSWTSTVHLTGYAWAD